jgi:hypothetical protein
LPALAYDDPAATPISVSGVINILTAPAHVHPTDPRLVLLASLGVAMLGVNLQSPVFAETATRPTVAALQFVPSDDDVLAAVAQAAPENPTAPRSGFFVIQLQDQQSPKTAIGDINEFGHRTASTVRGSSDGLEREAPTRCAS